LLALEPLQPTQPLRKFFLIKIRLFSDQPRLARIRWWIYNDLLALMRAAIPSLLQLSLQTFNLLLMLPDIQILPQIVARHVLLDNVLPDIVAFQGVLTHSQLVITVKGRVLARDAADGAPTTGWWGRQIVFIIVAAMAGTTVGAVGVIFLEFLVHPSRLGLVLRATL
jgi:hypothetical protein